MKLALHSRIDMFASERPICRTSGSNKETPWATGRAADVPRTFTSPRARFSSAWPGRSGEAARGVDSARPASESSIRPSPWEMLPVEGRFEVRVSDASGASDSQFESLQIETVRIDRAVAPELRTSDSLCIASEHPTENLKRWQPQDPPSLPRQGTVRD